MTIEYLRLTTALAVVEEAGFVIRDVGLLEGALGRSQATGFGQDAYPDIDHKAAALCESINRSYPLIDGNKRLSWTLTVVFYGLNGYDLAADDVDDAESTTLRVAAGELGLVELAAWLAAHRTATDSPGAVTHG